MEQALRSVLEEGLTCPLHLPPPSDVGREAWICLGMIEGLFCAADLDELRQEHFYHAGYAHLFAVLSELRPTVESKTPVTEEMLYRHMRGAGDEEAPVGLLRLLAEVKRHAPYMLADAPARAARRLQTLATYRVVLDHLARAEAVLRLAGEKLPRYDEEREHHADPAHEHLVAALEKLAGPPRAYGHVRAILGMVTWAGAGTKPGMEEMEMIESQMESDIAQERARIEMAERRIATIRAVHEAFPDAVEIADVSGVEASWESRKAHDVGRYVNIAALVHQADRGDTGPIKHVLYELVRVAGHPKAKVYSARWVDVARAFAIYNEKNDSQNGNANILSAIWEATLPDGAHDGRTTAILVGKGPEPIHMILTCPAKGCGERHIDRGEFECKPHHTHSCQLCGHTWRPCVVHTVGVQFLPGFKDPPAE